MEWLQHIKNDPEYLDIARKVRSPDVSVALTLFLIWSVYCHDRHTYVVVYGIFQVIVQCTVRLLPCKIGLTVFQPVGTNVLLYCDCQLLRQVSAECHSRRRPLTVLQPVGTNVLLFCDCQLLRQVSAECHSRRPLTVFKPVGTNVLLFCDCQLLCQVSAECHSRRRPLTVFQPVGTNVLLYCDCQLLRQVSAECHSRRRPLTVVEPHVLDDHYLTVNDPTAVRLLAGHNMSTIEEHFQSPMSPSAARPVSSAAQSGGIVLRLRHRTQSGTSRHTDNRQSVILYDRHQIDRRAKRTSHRPSYRRFDSTPNSKYSPASPP